jgi:hypothetical protein
MTTATASIPASGPAVPVASRETHEAARAAVRELLGRSPAFAALTPEMRRELAQGLVKIGSALAEPGGVRLKPEQQSPRVLALADEPAGQPFGQALRAGVEQAGALMQAVNFPAFVTGLINGVFDSIVTSSIQQMEAYAKLVADVSKSLSAFRDENTTPNQGRDHLVDQFPDIFEITTDTGDFGGFGDEGQQSGGPRVAVRQDVDERKALERINTSLNLEKPLTKLDDEVAEALLVPAARTTIATGRQQLLATMVMLGINRIVVTEGKISAKVLYDFQARDNRRFKHSATKFDYEKDAYGNLQKTRGYEGEYEGKSEGGSYSKDKESEERRDASYYSKGSYKYSEQPVVKLMSATQLQDDSSLQAKASLAGQVEVNFKSDYLPLDKLANPEAIASIQMNAQPGMVGTLARRPQPAAGAQPAPASQAPAPAAQPPR